MATARAGGVSEWLLLAASHEDSVDRVRTLLEAGGVDVNVRGSRGETPLHKAVATGDYEMVELLLRAGAWYDATDSNGATPLHSASHRGWEDLVGLLLNAGADPGAATKTGRTPLHSACYNAKSRLARTLLAAGADHDAKDHIGRKPLHLCLRRDAKFTDDTLATVQELVSFGARWDKRCDELISMGRACEVAPALRTCVLLWAQQRARGTPLTQVQLEVVSRGAQAVEAFFKEYAKSHVIYHRRKICVVGPSKAGKTSFIKSVVSEVSSLEHPDDRTIGVDQFKLGFTVTAEDRDDIHEVTFWDFAGQDEYQVAHSLFYSRRTLYLVCVDLEAYLLAYIQSDITNDTKTQRERMMNEFIERSVLKWVRAIFARQPDAEFVFVATKEDLLVYPKFTEELKRFLAVKLGEVEGIVRELQREITEQSAAVRKHRKADTLTLYAYNKRVMERQTGGGQDSNTSVTVSGRESMRGNLRAAWNRTRMWITSAAGGQQIDTKVGLDQSPVGRSLVSIRTRKSPVITASRATLYISCSSKKSVAKARDAIEKLIHSSKRSFQMPESYSHVLDAVVATRNAVAKRDTSTRIMVVFASLDSTLDSLSKRLKIDRSTVRFVLQILHDLGDVLWYEDLGVPLLQRTVILDPMLLIDFVRQVITHTNKVDVLTHAELSEQPLWTKLHDEGRMLAMKQMLQKFQLVHPTHGKMKWDSDLIVPAFWKCKTPASWLFGYEDLRLASAVRAHDPQRPKERVRVHWQYMFAHEFPDALFDHLVVASYSPSKARTAGPDWILYREDGIFACRAMVARDVKTKQRVLQLEAVLSYDANENHTVMLWEAFEILGEAIVEVLRRYPGIVFTSTALDTDGKPTRLEDLFAFRRTIEMEPWMPPASTWELYKKCVIEASRA